MVVLSLAMHFDKTPEGRCVVLADWMEEPFEADTFYDCYCEALRQHANPPPRSLSAAAE